MTRPTHTEINHEYTDELICPYCGYEFSDSWEFDDSGEYGCYECEKKFHYSRNHSVTYCTKKLQDKQ